LPSAKPSRSSCKKDVTVVVVVEELLLLLLPLDDKRDAYRDGRNDVVKASEALAPKRNSTKMQQEKDLFHILTKIE
jgi:hypothetical protein